MVGLGVSEVYAFSVAERGAALAVIAARDRVRFFAVRQVAPHVGRGGHGGHARAPEDTVDEVDDFHCWNEFVGGKPVNGGYRRWLPFLYSGSTS